MYTNIFDELLLAATQAALFVLSVGYLSKRIDSISNRVSPLGSFLSWLTLHVWASWQIASIKPSPAPKKRELNNSSESNINCHWISYNLRDEKEKFHLNQQIVKLIKRGGG